ncbi:MAG: rhomboid family intramembrane serine protease [Actinomycetota bacterium]
MLTEDATCYRHPDIRAAVGCQRCGRPICPACMRQASIGHHCVSCASTGSQQVYNARNLPRDRPPVVVGLIAVNVLAFLVNQGTRGELNIRGLLFGPLVQDGEWWRIITVGFLHSGLFHLAMNMYGLWILGQALEEGLGRLRFGLMYLAGLLGGSFAVLAFGFNQPTVGASGAVLGLAGALAAVLWARGVSLTQSSLGFILALNLAIPIIIPGISFWGHLGGIVAGFGAGWLISWLPIRYRQTQQTALAATGALCGLLAVGTVVAALAGGFF